MENMVMIVSDVIITVLSFWILFKLCGYGGLIGESLSNIGYGTVIIGFSQIIETLEFSWFPINGPALEIIHHLIFIVGLALVALGFKRLMEGN